MSTEPPATSTSPCQQTVGASGAAPDIRGQAQPSSDPAQPEDARKPSDDGDSIIPGAGRSTVERAPLKGGELNAAVTSALVGIHTEYLGRGPKRASTFHYGNALVTLMHEVLTRAEKTLAQTDRSDAVHHIRQLYQRTMEADFCAAVERLTGQKVAAFISGNQLEPDIAAEIFILEARL